VEQAPGGTPSPDPQTDLGGCDGLNVLGRCPRALLAQLAAQGRGWEHAFILDYPPYESEYYLESFFENIAWKAVEQRLG
jgi:hypothetical protein